MILLKYLAGATWLLLAVVCIVLLACGVADLAGVVPSWYVASKPSSETIYVVNHAGRWFSDAQIEKAIPAWEQAANQDFAPVWHSPQVKIELVCGTCATKEAPRGSISAVFVKNGPIQGALAYHTVTDGQPQIVVYAGVADFYGYSNSVSFTHELFELLADPSVSITNQGYPYPQVCLQGGDCQPQQAGTIWANEVCDPVEAFAYSIDGTPISDFVTPNWFNDEVHGGVDFMDKIAVPFFVARGGYAQYWDGSEWNQVVDFRHAGRDAAGFLKGEKAELR